MCVGLAGAAALAPHGAHGQGCVASRGGSCFHLPGMELQPYQGFQAAVGYRWLHSDRHFRGDHEEENRQEEGSEVINDSNFFELSLSYAINPRFNVSLAVPFSVNDRSQVVRSNDVSRTILQRYSTQSAGIGDIRLMGNGWLVDPTTMPKGNLLLGLGVDMPTGQDDERDTFQVFDPSTSRIVAQERTVDQSIQPGDGGWGVVLELYGYYHLVERLSAYVNGGYQFTPEETNGVPTYRGSPYEAIMSIADTYYGRLGVDYMVHPKWGLSLSLGGRIEGVPVYDAIGGSDGFRRPGFAVSIEPGISLSRGGWMFNVATPVALYRNREQSVPDKQLSDATGTYRHGDAAFADYLVTATISKRF